MGSINNNNNNYTLNLYGKTKVNNAKELQKKCNIKRKNINENKILKFQINFLIFVFLFLHERNKNS